MCIFSHFCSYIRPFSDDNLYLTCIYLRTDLRYYDVDALEMKMSFTHFCSYNRPFRLSGSCLARLQLEERTWMWVHLSSGQLSEGYRPVRLAYKLYFFSQRTVFFSHNKSANNTFSHCLSIKRTEYSLRNFENCIRGFGPIDLHRVQSDM